MDRNVESLENDGARKHRQEKQQRNLEIVSFCIRVVLWIAFFPKSFNAIHFSLEVNLTKLFINVFIQLGIFR